jgi:hypothetical protein
MSKAPSTTTAVVLLANSTINSALFTSAIAQSPDEYLPSD